MIPDLRSSRGKSTTSRIQNTPVFCIASSLCSYSVTQPQVCNNTQCQWHVVVVDISFRHRTSRGLSQTQDRRTETSAIQYVDIVLY